MEEEKPHGHPGGQGRGQRDADEAHIENHIGPQPVQLQPELGPGCAPHHKEAQNPRRSRKAVDVIPHTMGGHQHDQHQQAKEEIGSPAHGGEKLEAHAPVPEPPQSLIKPLGGGTGDVHQPRKEPAGQAVGPGPGYTPLPPDEGAEGALAGLAAEEVPNAVQGAANAAGWSRSAPGPKKGQQKPQDGAVSCNRHVAYSFIQPWGRLSAA